MCRGDAADSLCLRLRGEVNGTVDLPPGGRKRLSTLTAGMSFGQRARVSDGQRSADVPADTAVACGVRREGCGVRRAVGRSLPGDGGCAAGADDPPAAPVAARPGASSRAAECRSGGAGSLSRVGRRPVPNWPTILA